MNRVQGKNARIKKQEKEEEEAEEKNKNKNSKKKKKEEEEGEGGREGDLGEGSDFCFGSILKEVERCSIQVARFVTESDCLDVDFGIGESVETEGEDFVSEEGCKAFNGCAWNRLWGDKAKGS